MVIFVSETKTPPARAGFLIKSAALPSLTPQNKEVREQAREDSFRYWMGRDTLIRARPRGARKLACGINFLGARIQVGAFFGLDAAREIEADLDLKAIDFPALALLHDRATGAEQVTVRNRRQTRR